MSVVRALVSSALFVTALCVGGAAYAAGGEAWPIKNDDGCLVLGANLQFAVQAVVEKHRTIEEVVAFHNGKIDECFAAGADCIFTDKDEAKAFVDAAIPALVDAVKAGKLTVDIVAYVVIMQCHPKGEDVLPNGLKPTGPQLQS